MMLDKKIRIQLEKTPRTDLENSVIDNMKRFLGSDKREKMEKCFEVIRNTNNERVFVKSINEIEDEEFDEFFPLITTVILTANEIECDTLNCFASMQENVCVRRRRNYLDILPNQNVGVADAYVFELGDYYALHIHAYDTGSNTPGGSTDVVRYISNNPYLKPSLIVSFGVCYGQDPDKQNIGDVIIPQKLYPWSIGQKVVDKTLMIKSDNFNLWLYNAFRTTSNLYPSLRKYCTGESGKTINASVNDMDFNVKVKMGDMSTGEAVVSSENLKELIIDATRNPKYLGGEMEGYGIAKECIYYAKIPCMLLKSICDWGVMKNIDDILKEDIECPMFFKDKLQAYASVCAAIVLFDLFAEYKHVFNILGLIEFVSQERSGRNFLSRITAEEKVSIIKVLTNYYGNYQVAEKVFECLINKNVITEAPRFPEELNTFKICKRVTLKEDVYGNNKYR